MRKYKNALYQYSKIFSGDFMQTHTPPPLPGKQSGSWWQRNWKWFVPVSLGSIVVFFSFIMLIVTFVFGLMKSCDAYKGALAMAQNNPYVQEALGSPIEDGLLVMGNITVNGSSGHADLSIPVSGPHGRGRIFVLATKSAGQWTFQTLVVDIETTNERIDLIADNLTSQNLE
jgi:hypothetical protein